MKEPSYGFYSTQAVLLRGHGHHSPVPEIVPLVDKYHMWISLIIETAPEDVHYYLASRFDYVKEPFGRFSRGILVVDVPSFKEIVQSFLLSVKDLFQSGVADFSYEERIPIPKSLDTNREEVIEQTSKYIYDYMTYPEKLFGISDIPFREISGAKICNVEYPSLYHRWLFVESLKAAFLMSGTEGLENYVAALKSVGDSLVYPLINYSKSAPTTLGGLWFISSGEGMPHE